MNFQAGLGSLQEDLRFLQKVSDGCGQCFQGCAQGARTMAVTDIPDNFRDSLQKYLPTELFTGFPGL